MSENRGASRPSRLATWILKVLFPDRGEFTTVDDLAEAYQSMIEEAGPREARRWYRNQVLKSIPQVIAHRLTWSFVLFGNYGKVAFRTIKHQKAYTFINVAGLAVAHLPEGFSPENSIIMRAMNSDGDFLDTLGIPLVAGRNFSPDFPSDSRKNRVFAQPGTDQTFYPRQSHCLADHSLDVPGMASAFRLPDNRGCRPLSPVGLDGLRDFHSRREFSNFKGRGDQSGRHA